MTYIPKKPRMVFTGHQYEVLRIVIAGNSVPDSTLQLADLDEILERTTRTTSKQSMQFTIRALVQAGMIEKAGRVTRRGRLRVTFNATDLGKQIGDDRAAAPPFIEPELDEAIAGCVGV